MPDPNDPFTKARQRSAGYNQYGHSTRNAAVVRIAIISSVIAGILQLLFAR